MAVVFRKKQARTAPVRGRQLLLIIILTLAVLILGGSRIVTSVQSAVSYQRVEQLANMSYDVTGLAGRLEDERDQTLDFIGQGAAGRAGMLAHSTGGGAPQNLQLLNQYHDRTNPLVRKVRADAAGIGSGYPEPVQTEARTIGNLLKLLPPLRTSATTTPLPQTQVIRKYAVMIDQLLTIDDNMALDSGDPALTNDVRALNLVSLIAEGASEQRGLLAYAFAQDGTLNQQVLGAVSAAQAAESANIAEYDRVATSAQVSLFNKSVSGSLVDFASKYELQAVQFGREGRPLSVSPVTANEWYGAMSTGIIGGVDAVQHRLVATTISRASDLRRRAIITASGVGAIVLIVLLALLLTAFVGPSRAGRPPNRS